MKAIGQFSRTIDAHALFDLERTLHLDIERPLNRWLAGHRTLTVLANYEYAFTYVLSAFLLLGWVWWRRPDVYRWARTSFVWLNLLGCACFALYPLMPPRLLRGTASSSAMVCFRKSRTTRRS